ncbi:metabolite traffic protein EboE [Mangrovihabitans endophyticus]|uniref:Xylose isomerase n=1 Tax=Mangrovihabitans endophyticus TaxID=1751298 RepID=A0A8J3BVX2_9ACTN|nr:metabolite traffic protein EboE [Mangrovihabitans endophyticus]GGK73265.1 xylose isomerase [Mangrovihabitans endophyticus]
MRLRHPDGATVHLGYCTNVHPAEDLAGVIGQLDRYAVPVRERLGADVLGLGLWLAAPVADELAADAAAVRRLRAELNARGLEVVTLNGFPYRAFQAPVVKHGVYHPDWSTPERLSYTLRLADIQAGLLPDGAVHGSISTLPLAWREPWDAVRADRCARALDALAAGLAAVQERTGRVVRVGFEPEPGCVVETIADAVGRLSGADTTRLGVCLDLAHLACGWQEPSEAVRQLGSAGLPIVKVQVSAALASDDPAAQASALRRYAEPRFLHQVRDRAGFRADDLGAALTGDARQPWRIHYHVPLHAEPEPPLTSTMDVTRAGLRAIVGGQAALCDHLEIETYTWEVLPSRLRPRTDGCLADGIAAEIAFARDELTGLGLASTTAVAS